MLFGTRRKVPGRGVTADFGTYWVVPDDTKVCYAHVTGEQITESEFAKLDTTWKAIKGGTSKIQISEVDKAGTTHAGFEAKILGYLGKLLSRPSGRKLVMDLANGSRTVTIKPSAGKLVGGASANAATMGAVQKRNGTAGIGSDTTIFVDPDLKDDTVVVYDKNGKEIADPGFIVLGHEMIHAKHNAEGMNQSKKVGGGWDISAEEDETISEGNQGVSENDLRTEHKLAHRKGHAGRDTR